MEKLSGFYAKQYAKQRVRNKLTVHFPDLMSWIKQRLYLMEIENQVLKAVITKMESDVARLTPFPSDTEQDKLDKQAVVETTVREVKKWGEEARAEANNGSNWKNSSLNSYTFKEGKAFKQLKAINISGWKN